MAKKIDIPVYAGQKLYIALNPSSRRKEPEVYRAVVKKVSLTQYGDGKVDWEATISYGDDSPRHPDLPDTIEEGELWWFHKTKKEAMINAYSESVEELVEAIKNRKESCAKFVKIKNERMKIYKEAMDKISGKTRKKVANKADKKASGRFRHLDVS